MHKIISEAIPQTDFKKVRCVKGYKEIRRKYSSYLSDESKFPDEGAEYLLFPNDENELSAVLQEMVKRDIKVTISGARTGLVGGAVPFGGSIVSIEKLDKILGLRYDGRAKEWLVLAECGVTLRDLNDWVKKKSFPGLEKRGSDETRAFLQKFKEDPSAYFYPPDPTEMSASLGGTVATNASGARTYRYGATRNWVRRIRVMLASGEILDIPRGKYLATPEGEFTLIDSKGNETVLKIPTFQMPGTKNAAGIFSAPKMDFVDLFVGSEGLFGVITRVEVALQKWHSTISVVQFLPSDDQAIDFVVALREEQNIQPEFLEFYDSNSLRLLREKQMQNPKTIDLPPIPDEAKSAIFFDLSFDPDSGNNNYSDLENIVSKCGSSLSNSWAGYEQRDLARFKNFRHVLPEVVNGIIAEKKKALPQLHKLGTDLAVPDHALRTIWKFYKSKLEDSGLMWVAFGHIGNNHIHINILPENIEEMNLGLLIYEEFARKAVALGGTVSAEHGIGKIKKKFLPIMFSSAELEEMKQMKQALDPHLVLNPENILDI